MAVTFAVSPRRRRGRRRTSLADLQQQERELTALQQQFGAPGIEQDKPGIFRKIIDVLSRPNYAIAGFAEELFGEEPSVERGVKRALTEIFSGVGGIKGEKRAFGEVLENLGVGTVTLADAFPALEGTWVGNFGSRGAAGLALDIATDPLTYMTFGAFNGMKVATSKGLRYLNRAGKAEWNTLFAKHLDEARAAIKGTDDVATARVFDRALSATEQEFEALFTKGDDIAKELLEPGGAKLFGAKIPGTDQLGPAMRKTIDMLPESISKPAVEGATQMRDGMMRMVNGLFSPEGALANLPQPIRDRAVRLTNSFFRSSTAHRSHLMSQIEPLERAYRKLERADPGIGKRWYDVREEVLPKSALKENERALYEQTMALYESMGQTLVEHGVFTDARILDNYIFHQYKNAADLAQYHPRPGVKVEPGGNANFEKQRKFESFWMAEEESRRMHELSLQLAKRGELDKSGFYPILEPEYDVMKNLRKYAGQHADVLARRAWREEMVEQFGKTADELAAADMDALYEAGELAGKAPDPSKLPLVRAIDEGDIEKTLEAAFGPQGAQYVAVKGKHTGDELVFLPRAISDALESVNSSLFNTREYREFGKLLRGFDWLNNNFKWGVYTVWPASATRDGYSNIALSMLRIGLAALDPKRHVDAIKLMAKRGLGDVFADTPYTVGQLRDLSKTLGVWVPGQVFVEQTGRFKLGKFRRALTEKRAAIENEARVLLWMEEIRRGADPRTAADTVGQFLFNYGEVSRVERDLFRRLIPFYTFTRKNVELQAKALRRNPGMVINQLKPFRGRQEENESLVKFEGEAAKLRLDKNGKNLHVLTGVDLPLRNLDTVWAGGFGASGRRIMGMLTPILKVPLEITVQRDLFTGGELKRTRADTMGRVVEMTNTPKFIRDWIGYKKEYDDAGRPRYTMDGRRYALLVRSWMFSRFFSTTDRQFREYADDANISRALLDFMTGLRVKDLNLDEQAERKIKRRIRQLQDSLVRRGVLPEFTVRGRKPTAGER